MAVTAYASGTQTAVVGATRTAVDAVTNSTVLITSATIAWVAGDVGQRLSSLSNDIPIGAVVATVSSGTNVNLNISATGTHTGQIFALTNEFALATVSAAGTYTMHVDAVNMTAADRIELRAYQTILTGGLSHVAYYATYDGAQPPDDMIKISVPISNELTDTNSLQFTLRQVAGTARTFPWKVLKHS